VEGELESAFLRRAFGLLTKVLKSIAEPLLWNTVVIDGLGAERRLMDLRANLFESVYVHHRHLGKMIRSLDVDILREKKKASSIKESVRMIILMAPGLCRYRFRAYYMGQLDFITLSNMSAASLTHLEVTIHTKIDNIFPIINTFVTLHSLVIEIKGEEWRHSSAHPLNICSLKHLAWSSDSSDLRMAAFLSQSSLAPGAQVRLVLDCMIYDIIESATLLKHLFLRNTIQEIEVITNSDLLSALMPQIMQCPEVIFCCYIPPFASQDLVHEALPRKITIKGTEREFEVDLLWDALDALASLPPLVDNTMTLIISFAFGPIDGWEPTAEHTGFVGRLLQHAVVLYRRGIIVIDKNGRDVSSLVNV
jgi:hypothetical protein